MLSFKFQLQIYGKKSLQLKYFKIYFFRYWTSTQISYIYKLHLRCTCCEINYILLKIFINSSGSTNQQHLKQSLDFRKRKKSLQKNLIQRESLKIKILLIMREGFPVKIRCKISILMNLLRPDRFIALMCC